MHYVKLGSSGLKVSQLCLGTWHLPRSREKDDYGIPKIDEEELKKILKVAMDNGLNFIDTANRYHGAMAPVDFSHLGNAERVLGRLLKEFDRESFVIATKVGLQMAPWSNGAGLSRKHIMWQIRESLARLQMEYVDIYFIHTSDPETPKLETLKTFNQLVEQGKVHYIGCSNLKPEEIEECMMLAKDYRLHEFVTMQELYNLLQRDFEEGKAPIARKYNMALMAYSPLAQGILAGRYLKGVPEDSRAVYSKELQKCLEEKILLETVKELEEMAREKAVTLAQIVLAWLFKKQEELGITIIPIVAVSKLEQLTENLAALEIKLTNQDMRRLEETVSKAKI